VHKKFTTECTKRTKEHIRLSVSNAPNLHICTLINLHIFPCLSAFAAGDPCDPCSYKKQLFYLLRYRYTCR